MLLFTLLKLLSVLLIKRGGVCLHWGIAAVIEADCTVAVGVEGVVRVVGSSVVAGLVRGNVGRGCRLGGAVVVLSRAAGNAVWEGVICVVWCGVAAGGSGCSIKKKRKKA